MTTSIENWFSKLIYFNRHFQKRNVTLNGHIYERQL